MAYRDEWIEEASELPYADWLEFRLAAAEFELRLMRTKAEPLANAIASDARTCYYVRVMDSPGADWEEARAFYIAFLTELIGDAIR